MTNSRGEIKIQLAGEERIMRPTFEAISKIERDLSINTLPLLKKMSTGDIGLHAAAVVIYHGLRGYDDTRLTLTEVGDAVIMQGLNELGVSISEFLITALEGVKNLGKNVEVKTETPTS